MRRLGLALPVLLAACVAPSAPPPPPPTPTLRPAPPPPPPAPLPADWRDRAYAPGDWSYARTGGLSEAAYGAPGAPRLTLSCDPRSGQLRLNWRDVSTGPITVRTTYGDVVRQTQSVGGVLHLVIATRDPLLDQMAYSRGRFMLAAGGQELIVPAWPEVARVVEDCR